MTRRFLILAGAMGTGVAANVLVWMFAWAELPPLTYRDGPAPAVLHATQSSKGDAIARNFDPSFLGRRQPALPTASSLPQSPVRPPLRLIGLASEDGILIAILQTSSTEILRARLGDAVEGWAVRSIGRRDVLMAGPQGEQRLHLDDR